MFASPTNAIERLSGDQNGYVAPSVPASCCGVAELIGRTNRAVVASAADATKAIHRPSGDTARLVAFGDAGTDTRKPDFISFMRTSKVEEPLRSQGDRRQNNHRARRDREQCPANVFFRRRGAGWTANCVLGFPDPPKLAREIPRRLPAFFGILRETPLHEQVERRRRRGLHFRIGSGFRGHDCGNQVRWLLPFERLPARDHLVEHGAERKDVRPRVGFLAFELFRRHVLHRAEDRAGRRVVPTLGRR